MASVVLYPCILCVSLLMDLFVFVSRVCESFGKSIGKKINLGVVDILLLNVMEVFSVGALLDRPRMVFKIMCVLCL